MSFWKPGTVAPGSSIDRDADGAAGGAGGAGAVTGRVQANVAVSQRRDRLPIAKEREQLSTVSLPKEGPADQPVN